MHAISSSKKKKHQKDMTMLPEGRVRGKTAYDCPTLQEAYQLSNSLHSVPGSLKL
jgi:hypothetical protein